MRRAILLGFFAIGGLVVGSRAALALYPTAFVYPLGDDTYLYKVAWWNLPPVDNFYVSKMWMTGAVIPGTVFGPPGWFSDPDRPVWTAEALDFMIPPGKAKWGFGFRATYLREPFWYSAYGYDPETGHRWKWAGEFTPVVIPEPGWVAVVAAGAVPLMAWGRRRAR